MLEEHDTDLMTDAELHERFTSNYKALGTAIREIIGDEPMPDPRELADLMGRLPLEEWDAMWSSTEARSDLAKQMDLLLIMTELQQENVVIMAQMLKRR